jgi:hypothetical protein
MARGSDVRDGPRELEPATRAELEAASREVDETLLRWWGQLSLRERLRACTRAARALGRFGGGPPAAGRS